MSEPVADYCHIHAGRDQLNADAVTPRVWRDLLCRERRYVPGGRQNIFLELEANASGAERPTISIDEDGFVIRAGLSSQQRL